MTRPDWTQAACRNTDRDRFFTDDDEVEEAIIALCHTCPIRDDCFDWATHHGEHGYWGATTRQQRQALTAGIRRAKCPACAAPAPYRRGQTQICGFCGMSWHIKPEKTPAPHASAT